MFSLRKHYPFIFSLNAVPALLRYPKLFARYSLRTILTATPTHTPCFRHRRRSCSLPSSKRGTPPFKIYSIGRVIAPREAYIIASQTLNLPLAICNLQLGEASCIRQRSSEICHLPFPICHFANVVSFSSPLFRIRELLSLQRKR